MNSLLKTIIFTLLCFTAIPLHGKPSKPESKDFVVVLDPGHGGKDAGAVGAITNEKTINLNVALAVRDMLKERKGISVVMTRSDDRFIELQERANIANRNHGNLFISIHVNSVDRKNRNRNTICGASVYALGLHRSASNLEVAKRENSVMELEADYTERYQGFDPNSTESYIIFELSQNEHLDQSIRFAELTESELCSTAGRHSRGVLQAGFWVLHASAMPAVLVELDFICNPQVEKFLNSSDGQKKMARSIANAVIAYSSGYSAPALVIDPPSSHPAHSDVAPEEPAVTDTDAVTWRVQFVALDRSLPASSPEFKGLEKVEEYQQGGMHKYTAGGDFTSENAAEAYARDIVRKHFPQAFVIKWQNGQRIN